MKSIIFLLFISSSLCYFTNPVIYADTPEPCVLFFNNYYYSVTIGSNSYGHFPIRKSEDLVNWEEIGVIFTPQTTPSWAVSDVSIKLIFIIFNSFGVLHSMR